MGKRQILTPGRRRVCHPLEFVNSQQVPVSPPEPLPKLRKTKIVYADLNRNEIMEPKPWIVPDSQMSFSPVKPPTVARARIKKVEKPGTLGYATRLGKVRRRPQYDIANLPQKGMVEGSSSAEEISPSEIKLCNSGRKETSIKITRKSPRKNVLQKATVRSKAFATPVRLSFTVNHHPTGQPAAPPPETPAAVSQKHLNAVRRGGKNIRISQPPVPASLQNVSPSGSPTASTGYRTTQLTDDSFNGDGQDSNQPNQSLNQTDDEPEGPLASLHDALREEDVQRSAERMSVVLDLKSRMFIIGTPETSVRVIIADDTPEYRAGRLTCSLAGSPDYLFPD